MHVFIYIDPRAPLDSNPWAIVTGGCQRIETISYRAMPREPSAHAAQPH